MKPVVPEKKKRRRVGNKVLNIILTLVFLGGLTALVYSIAVPNTGKSTELYILGLSGQADDYPRQLKVGEQGQVVVGIVNREREVTVYRLEVYVEGDMFKEISPIQLDDGERWQEVVGFTLQNPGNKQKIEFLLYKFGLEEPYLSRRLWIDAW